MSPQRGDGPLQPRPDDHQRHRPTARPQGSDRGVDRDQDAAGEQQRCGCGCGRCGGQVARALCVTSPGPCAVRGATTIINSVIYHHSNHDINNINNTTRHDNNHHHHNHNLNNTTTAIISAHSHLFFRFFSINQNNYNLRRPLSSISSLPLP